MKKWIYLSMELYHKNCKNWTVSEISDTTVVPVNSPNADRFSKFLYLRTQQ